MIFSLGYYVEIWDLFNALSCVTTCNSFFYIQEEELNRKKKQVEQEQQGTEQLLGTIESEKQVIEIQRQNLEEKKRELAKEEQVILFLFWLFY